MFSASNLAKSCGGKAGNSYFDAARREQLLARLAAFCHPFASLKRSQNGKSLGGLRVEIDHRDMVSLVADQAQPPRD